MAETTADVRRDIELTRERMSSTLQELEHKLNIAQVVKDNPWPSIALAVGAGVLLSGSRVDVKAAAATVAATQGASGKVGTLLDDLVANLVQGVSSAFNERVESWVSELKTSIGAPQQSRGSRANFGDGAPGYGTGPTHRNALPGDMGAPGATPSGGDGTFETPRAD
jgi:hypothetical protein